MFGYHAKMVQKIRRQAWKRAVLPKKEWKQNFCITYQNIDFWVKHPESTKQAQFNVTIDRPQVDSRVLAHLANGNHLVLHNIRRFKLDEARLKGDAVAPDLILHFGWEAWEERKLSSLACSVCIGGLR